MTAQGGDWLRLADVLKATGTSYRMLHALTKKGLIDSPSKGPNPRGRGQVSLYPACVIDKIREIQSARQGRWAGYRADPVKPARQSVRSFYHLSAGECDRPASLPIQILIREGDRASMGWAMEYLSCFEYCSKISSQGGEVITGAAWVVYDDMFDPVDVAPVTAEGSERILMQYGGYHVIEVKILEGGKL